MHLTIHVIMGKTLAGKSTLINNLSHLQQYSVPRVITTTTRPKRQGEVDNQDYHFVTDNQYQDDRSNSRAIAPRDYVVANGQTWHYYINANDLTRALNDIHTKDVCLILDYVGLKELTYYVNQFNQKNNGNYYQLEAWFLDIDLKTRLARYLLGTRNNEDAKETLRRLYDDEFNAFTDLDNEAIIKHYHVHKIKGLTDILPTLLNEI